MCLYDSRHRMTKEFIVRLKHNEHSDKCNQAISEPLIHFEVYEVRLLLEAIE
jgi:hypothetical protein